MAVGVDRPLAKGDEKLDAGDGDRASDVRLALEVRPHRLGFAVLHGTLLLDWGARRCPGSEVALDKLRLLLKLYRPSMAIARGTRPVANHALQATAIMEAIREELARDSVPFVMLSRSQVQEFFVKHGCPTKHEVALLLIREFAGLERIVPRKRRPWDPEAHSTVILDAVATCAAYDGAADTRQEQCDDKGPF